MTASRTDTQTIEVGADPGDAFTLLASVSQLPRWAHAFVDTVEPGSDPTRWMAVKDGQAFPLRVVVHDAARTVDYLPGEQGDVGGYARVLPRPAGGAVVLFTQPLPPEVDAARAARVTVTAELQALRGLLAGRRTW